MLCSHESLLHSCIVAEVGRIMESNGTHGKAVHLIKII